VAIEWLPRLCISLVTSRDHAAALGGRNPRRHGDVGIETRYRGGQTEDAHHISGKKVVKGSLRFICKVGLPFGSGELEIADVMVFSSHGKSWANLPSKPVLDQNGVHMTAENGKKMYAPFLEWSSKELRDRFSAAVVALVRAEHPDALDDSASRNG
jgi:hypothetical protein